MAGTILAKFTVARAQTIIQDKTGVRWPIDEMLGWLNEGQRQIVSLRPDACASTETVRLVAGTEQRIPEGGWRMLAVRHNMGLDAATPGKAIRLVERDILDTQLPEWKSSTPSAVVVHWVYDDREPSTYEVFPPQPGSGQSAIRIVYSRVPIDCKISGVIDEKTQVPSTTDTVISLLDVYEPALIDFIVYRSYCKNAAYVTQGLDMQYWNKMLMSLGLKTEVDKAFTPKRNAPPEVNRNIPSDSGAFGRD